MNLEDTLLEATKQCSHEVEEEGGVILYNTTLDSYDFIKLRNQNEGTSIAPVLWTADRDEYAKFVIPLYSKGWKHYASFHTHPRFIPRPSSIDINVLFPGFPINYIYSRVIQEITQWNVDKDNTKDFNFSGKYIVENDSVTYETDAGDSRE